MKRHGSYLILTVAIVAVVALASPADAQQRRASAQVGPGCSGGFQALFDEIEPVELLGDEVTWILYLYEEEKLARDVYLALADRWELPIFANIARAEQRHMELVYKLAEVYDFIDQLPDDTEGSFPDPFLRGLYDQFIVDGQVDLVPALIIGASIEDMDLADLYDLIELTDNDHIELVAHNLAKGSRNHLRAFVRALNAQGVAFTPTELDQNTFIEILDAEMERQTLYDADGKPVPACGAAVGGFGMRRGQGNGGGTGDGNGQGNGDGECDGSGSDSNGDGECDGSGSNGGGNGNGNGGGGGGGD